MDPLVSTSALTHLTGLMHSQESPCSRPWRRFVGVPEPEFDLALSLALDPMAEPMPLQGSPRPQQSGRVAESPEAEFDVGIDDTLRPPESSLTSPILLAMPLPAPPLAPRLSSTIRNPPDSSDWPQHMVDANRYFTEVTTVMGGASAVSNRD